MSHSEPDFLGDVRNKPRPIDRVVTPFVKFLQLESAGGLVLMGAAVIALVAANSPLGHAWHEFWTGTVLQIKLGEHVFPSGKHAGHFEWWVNDALMAIFFFVVGLELKREFLTGELRNPRKAALPLIAAVGGMAVPGLIYAAANWGQPTLRGWAIPTATDIAFALGVLALLGNRVPAGLRVFLVTLAIADDLGALLIIAFFYTDAKYLSMPSLGMAFGVMGVMAVLNVMGVRRWWVYGILGLGLWWFVLHAGVHATIAGVMGAMTIPVKTRIDAGEYERKSRELLDSFRGDVEGGYDIVTSPTQRGVISAVERLAESVQTPLHRLEKLLLPISAFVVVPIFALANAGVSLGDSFGAAVRDREAWGIVGGLVLGKTLGIFGFALLAVKLKLCVLPTHVTWRHMLGAAMLGGIGFTMSLFIAQLAFAGPENVQRLEIAKLAVLTGSTISAVLGAGVLLTCKRNVEAGH
jgi:NhaA family Na+:H+ antiporter